MLKEIESMETKKSKIAAVVVLYNPTMDITKNIDSYLDQIDYLFAVDNSENNNSSIISKLEPTEKIKYVNSLKEND